MEGSTAAALKAALATRDGRKLQEGIQLLAQAVAMLREQANAAFKRAAYGEAIDMYTWAIAGAPTDATLYGNRCLARIKAAEAVVKKTGGQGNGKESGGSGSMKGCVKTAGAVAAGGKAGGVEGKENASGRDKEGDGGKRKREMLELALADAERAIAVDSTWLKGYFRKGSVLFLLGRYKEARPYLLKVANAAPNDAEVQRMLGVVDAKVILKEEQGCMAAAVHGEEEQDLEMEDGDARSIATTDTSSKRATTGVELPRKVYYPTQDWFARNKIAPGLQTHLKDYSDMDGPRRLIETLQDRALVAYWLQILQHEQQTWWGEGDEGGNPALLSASSSDTAGQGEGDASPHPSPSSSNSSSNSGRRRPRRCLLIGSLGGVAPFQLLPSSTKSGSSSSSSSSDSIGDSSNIDKDSSSTTTTTTILITERSSWVARTVKGVVAKNLQLRQQHQHASSSSFPSPSETEGGSAAAPKPCSPSSSSTADGDVRITVLKSPPLELTPLEIAGLDNVPASIAASPLPPLQQQPLDPSLQLDRVFFMDWDASLLGTNVVKTFRRLQREGYLSPDCSLSPSHYSLYAMGVELLPSSSSSSSSYLGDKKDMMGQLPSSSGNKEGKGSEGVMRQEEGVHKEGEEGEQSSPVPVPIPPSLPKMVWEVGPSKFELPEEARAYKPLTAPTPIWEGQPFLASSPKVKEVSFRVTAQGTMHAVVYWFCCHMGDGLPPLDARAFPSIGRGVCYIDPTPTLSNTVTLRAYRTESQVGFWPLKTTGGPMAEERSYRLPRWYPAMLLDGARNRAYHRAITRVCAGKRVLEAGSGTGLLASMLETAGAAKVLGCEQEPALAQASHEILSPRTKIFTKDVRKLSLNVPPEVIVHELFDAGLLGEGVLHLLQPIRQTAKRLLPARAVVYGQLMQLRFDEIGGVNLTLLNPYRFQKEYHSSPFHPSHGEGAYARPLSDPFVVDHVDFATDMPNQRGLVLPEITATDAGVVSAVRLWHEVDFGDDDDGASTSSSSSTTRLDSRQTHWGFAVMYITEARFDAGQRVPLVGVRLGSEYAFRLASAADALLSSPSTPQLLPTPRCDMAWVSAMERLEKTSQDILMRVANPRLAGEAAGILKAAYRIASHPAEFGIDPLMAARFFHAVLRAKLHAQEQQAAR